jgi:hypothetical protein
MWVVRIEPALPGYNKRTFECTKCNREEIVIARRPRRSEGEPELGASGRV